MFAYILYSVLRDNSSIQTLNNISSSRKIQVHKNGPLKITLINKRGKKNCKGSMKLVIDGTCLTNFNTFLDVSA